MKSKILIILILNAVLASSCIWSEHHYDQLTEAQKQAIPYKLGQVISFIDSLGITFDATVTKDTTYWSCVEDFYYKGYIQNKVVRLKSDSVNFDVELYAYGICRCYETFGISIVINGSSFFDLCFDTKGRFYPTNGYYSQNIYSNLEINNIFYYDVAESINYYDENNIKCKFNSIFYNKTYGILKIEDKDKVLFTINN